MVPGTTFVVYAEEQLFGMLTTLFFGTPGRSGVYVNGLHFPGKRCFAQIAEHTPGYAYPEA